MSFPVPPGWSSILLYPKSSASIHIHTIWIPFVFFHCPFRWTTDGWKSWTSIAFDLNCSLLCSLFVFSLSSSCRHHFLHCLTNLKIKYFWKKRFKQTTIIYVFTIAYRAYSVLLFLGSRELTVIKIIIIYIFCYYYKIF